MLGIVYDLPGCKPNARLNLSYPILSVENSVTWVILAGGMGDMVKVLHVDREVSFGNRHSKTSTPKGFEKIIAPYYRVLACKWFMMSNGIESANVVTKIPISSNQYLFQDFTRILLTGFMVNHSKQSKDRHRQACFHD